MFIPESIRAKLTEDEIAAMELEVERQAAESRKAGNITCKVAAKGGVSIYGHQRSPTTLYANQWKAVLEGATLENNRILAFIDSEPTQDYFFSKMDERALANIRGNMEKNPEIYEEIRNEVETADGTLSTVLVGVTVSLSKK
jgi:hypothetical protein